MLLHFLSPFFTCSPLLREMKLAEVKAAPGPVESASAMSGLQCSKRSLPLKQLRCGAGRILSVLTVPCRQLSTSCASPFIGSSHI